MEKNKKTNIINAITSPLGFFVLALLIVETFLGITTSIIGFDVEKKYYLILIGVGLFILVIFIVLMLVWFRPINLTFGEKGHLQKQKLSLENEKIWGSSDKPNKKLDIEQNEVVESNGLKKSEMN